MGVDVNLYAVGTVSDEEIEHAQAFFTERGIDDQVQRSSYYPDRVEVYTLSRYYGPGYERGHWPTIYTQIVALRAALPNATVHYGGDTSEDGPVADDEYLSGIWAHWLSPNGDDYHKRG